jgi:hypothetical protein
MTPLTVNEQNQKLYMYVLATLVAIRGGKVITVAAGDAVECESGCAAIQSNVVCVFVVRLVHVVRNLKSKTGVCKHIGDERRRDLPTARVGCEIGVIKTSNQLGAAALGSYPRCSWTCPPLCFQSEAPYLATVVGDRRLTGILIVELTSIELLARRDNDTN